MVAAFPASAEAPSSSFPPVKPPESPEQADQLVLELGQLDALEARNEADCKKAVAFEKAKYSARNKTTVDGIELAIADRRMALQLALYEYAEPRKDELLAGKAKSVKCNHGTFGWRKSTDGLEPVDKGSHAGRASLLDKLVAFVVEKLIKFEGLSAAALACLNPQIKWDRDALLRARERELIDGAELYRIGFKVVHGQDEFFVKPTAVDLSSQSTSGAS